MDADTPVVECAWCTLPSKTQAKHTDGNLYPSCGEHGVEILPEPEWVDDVKEDAPKAQFLDPETRVITNAPKHNRNTWRRGCRCNVCRADHRLDLRERRVRKKEKKAEEAAAEERKKLQFPTLIAVQKQLTILHAWDSNPAIAAICVQMAKILDDPTTAPQQPAAAGKLLDALKELGVRPKQQSTQLATVRDMVNRPKPTVASIA